MYIEQTLNRMYKNINNKIFNNRLPIVNFTISFAKHIKKGWRINIFNNKIYNIILRYDEIFKDTEEIYMELLQQIVHIVAMENGIKDTSRAGRYNNGEFNKIAKKYGLIVEYKPQDGYIVTGLEEWFFDTIDTTKTRKNLNMAIIKDMELISRNSSGNIKYIKWECPKCKRVVQAYKNTKIICGYCMIEFLPEHD